MAGGGVVFGQSKDALTDQPKLSPEFYSVGIVSVLMPALRPRKGDDTSTRRRTLDEIRRDHRMEQSFVAPVLQPFFVEL